MKTNSREQQTEKSTFGEQPRLVGCEQDMEKAAGGERGEGGLSFLVDVARHLEPGTSLSLLQEALSPAHLCF